MSIHPKIGIMGGTFDPVHYGHLVTAEAVRAEFKLDKVVFVPSARPPHKKEQAISPVNHREMMTRLAVATNPYFEVSRLEIDRVGYSYAIDTVRAFHQLYDGAEIFFITGADAILEIITWKDIDQLMQECFFIAATRPGFQLDAVSHLPKDFLKKIIFMEVPALAISSSDIRQRIKTGRTIKYLVPDPVEQYILHNGLYGI